MSYTPPSMLLHGVPLAVAECYGKPHIGARYRVKGFDYGRKAALRAAHSHELIEGARCACCGRIATNAHHYPPLGTAITFEHPSGEVLRPSLIAVCGSGTTGCHNGWHGGARFRALWRWDSDEFARAWWEGDLLEAEGAHSPSLYSFGCWEFYDVEQGRIWQVRQ